MQEIAHDLAQLTEATTKLAGNVERLSRAADLFAEKLGCPIVEPMTGMGAKPLRRRNFKDALEAVLEMREKIAHIERQILAIQVAADPKGGNCNFPEV